MKRHISTFLLLILSVLLFAESNALEEYERFRQSAIKNYTDFRAAAMQNYAEFLNKAWKWYEAEPVISKPKEEPVPPVIYEEEQKQEDEEIVYEEVAPVPVPEPTPEPEPVVPIEDNKKEDAYRNVSMEFYGTPVTVRYPKDKQFQLKSTDGAALAEAWATLASEKFDATVYDCLEARDAMKLCDYAYLLLARQVASKALGEGNEATLLGSYIYAVSGYQMRLATSRGGKLYILFGSKYQIYDINYYDIDGSYFYPFDCDENGLQICSASFENEYPLSLAIQSEQKFAQRPSDKRTLKSDIGVTAGVSVNENLIAFYNNYPTAMINDDYGARWALYANTPLSKAAKDALYPALKSAINGKGTYVSLSILLNFVQTAFVYEYDDKVWGEDRAFFADETLYYPYADCEDRGILFSRLVRDIMGLDVVLLYYPGHIATAVNLNCNGDYLTVDGKKYVVCDPTYIGAPVGESMPGLDESNVRVIKLKR